MNMLPLINRNKKQLFCSPLAGRMFKNNNNNSEQKSDYNTISYSKRSTELGKLRSMRTQHKIKQSINQFELRSERSVNKSLRKVKMFDTVDSTRILEDTVQQKMKRSITKIAFTYPEVQIIPLYLVNSHGDIKKFTQRLSLQSCFKIFFHECIDHTSRQLIELLLNKLPKIKQLGMIDTPILKEKWPSQFWKVRSTDNLLSLIKIYNKNSDYWDKYLFTLLKGYCIPDQRVRADSLENLILLINKQLSKKLQISLHTEPMNFLLQDGTVVKDLIDIPFNTHILYLTSHINPEQSFVEFKDIIKKFSQETKKKGLIGKLQSHFRRQIVPNKYDQFSINYHKDSVDFNEQRKKSVKRAIDLLQKKKERSRNNRFGLSTLTFQPRPKQKQSLWRQENLQTSRVSLDAEKIFFHIDLGSKKLQQQVKKDFKYYHILSKQIDHNIGEEQVRLQTLERHHPVFKQMSTVFFYNQKLRKIWEILTGKQLPESYTTYTISWRYFLELWVLISRKIDTLVDRDDCYQLLRNFVEEYLEMKENQYFREQLSSKLFGMLEGDKQGVQMIEEVIWSWLQQSGFVEHMTVQRQLLWTYKARSKTFYLLMASVILGTFQTTPLDLAYQLLV